MDEYSFRPIYILWIGIFLFLFAILNYVKYCRDASMAFTTGQTYLISQDWRAAKNYYEDYDVQYRFAVNRQASETKNIIFCVSNMLLIDSAMLEQDYEEASYHYNFLETHHKEFVKENDLAIEHARVYMLLTEELIAQNNLKDAVKIYEIVSSRYENTEFGVLAADQLPDLYIQYIRDDLKKGNFPDAITTMQLFIQKYPDHDEYDSIQTLLVQSQLDWAKDLVANEYYNLALGKLEALAADISDTDMLQQINDLTFQALLSLLNNALENENDVTAIYIIDRIVADFPEFIEKNELFPIIMSTYVRYANTAKEENKDLLAWEYYSKALSIPWTRGIITESIENTLHKLEDKLLVDDGLFGKQIIEENTKAICTGESLPYPFVGGLNSDTPRATSCSETYVLPDSWQADIPLHFTYVIYAEEEFITMGRCEYSNGSIEQIRIDTYVRIFNSANGKEITGYSIDGDAPEQCPEIYDSNAAGNQLTGNPASDERINDLLQQYFE